MQFRRVRSLGAPATRRVDLLTILAFAAIAIAEQTRHVISLTRGHTNEDQTLIWLAGRTWWRGSVPQPDFWGQAYGITFEGIPAEFVRRLGGGWATSLVIALAAMHLLSWWILGVAASKRGLRVASLLAFAAPILLTTRWSAAVGVYTTAFGRIVAVLAVAVAIWPNPRRWSPFVVTALAGLAVLFDASTVLVIAPLLIWCFPQWRRAGGWKVGVFGLAAPLVWFGYLLAFRRAHHDHELHYRPSVRPSVDVLRAHLAHPSRLFDIFGAGLLGHWSVPFVVLVCVAVAIVRSRDVALALALAAFAVPTLFAIATPHSESGADPSFYLMSARVIYPLPFALWFLATILLDHRRDDRVETSTELARRSHASSVLIALVVATAVVRLFTVSVQYDHLVDQALDLPEYPIRSTDEVLDLCRRVDAVSDATGARLVVLPEDRPATYACAAMYPELTTLEPRFDRRTWVLHDLADRRVDSLLVWATPCADVAQGFDCTDVDGGSLIRVAAQPALEVVDRLGFVVRPFGDDCVPHQIETCTEWATRYPASAVGWNAFAESA